MQIPKFLQGIYYGKYEKYVHAAVSFLLFFFFLFWYHIIFALVFSFLVGVFKELFDKFIRKTKFDVFDILANVTGIGFAIILYLFFQ